MLVMFMCVHIGSKINSITQDAREQQQIEKGEYKQSRNRDAQVPGVWHG